MTTATKMSTSESQPAIPRKSITKTSEHRRVGIIPDVLSAYFLARFKRCPTLLHLQSFRSKKFALLHSSRLFADSFFVLPLQQALQAMFLRSLLLSSKFAKFSESISHVCLCDVLVSFVANAKVVFFNFRRPNRLWRSGAAHVSIKP